MFSVIGHNNIVNFFILFKVLYLIVYLVIRVENLLQQVSGKHFKFFFFNLTYLFQCFKIDVIELRRL